MTHSKLSFGALLGKSAGKSALISLLAAAIAVVGLVGGCTVEAQAPTEPNESVQSTTADLQVAPCQGVEPAAGAAKGSTPTIDIQIKADVPAGLLNPVIFGDHVLSGGGLVDDGPRPHPWAPPPDEAPSGGSSTGSADDSQK